jgi:electron transport complex protein RnfG
VSGGAKGGGGVTAAPGARAPSNRAEVLRIAASMTVTCALSAAILGGVYLGTERYAAEAQVRGERRAVSELLGLDSTASVLEVRQYLEPAKGEVVYRTAPASGEGMELVFSLDGALVRRGAVAAEAPVEKGLEPLGRLFVARRGDAPAGFVTEGETQGYKNRIRFFVALDAGFRVAGVRVVEHEEDPGLGAEVATSWFQGQYVGRTVANLPSLDVTRDPMPEDWRAALRDRGKLGPAEWRSRYASLLEREGTKPVYAVTGATISSRALTDGVRATAHHFERRWALLAPYLASGGAAGAIAQGGTP